MSNNWKYLIILLQLLIKQKIETEEVDKILKHEPTQNDYYYEKFGNILFI